MIEFSLIPWDSGDVLSQAVWRGGVMCTFSFYKDHPGKTGSRETSERLAIIPVKIIKALTELVIISKKRRGWMREVKGLEFTGIGGCGMGGEVWEGCWISLDFWIGWCWCLVRWGRKSSLGWVFRSSVQDCCIWGSVGPPGGARGLGSSYIEEPRFTRESQGEGLLSTGISGRKQNRWDWQEESEEKEPVIYSWF